MKLVLKSWAAKRLATLSLVVSALLLALNAALAVPPTPCTFRSVTYCESVARQFCFPFGNFNYASQQVYYCIGSTVHHPGGCYNIPVGGCCTVVEPPPGCPAPICPCPYP